MREIRSLNSAITRLDWASKLSHKIIREFSLRTLALEGVQRMLEALLNLELALININNDYLYLKWAY